MFDEKGNRQRWRCRVLRTHEKIFSRAEGGLYVGYQYIWFTLRLLSAGWREKEGGGKYKFVASHKGGEGGGAIDSPSHCESNDRDIFALLL